MNVYLIEDDEIYAEFVQRSLSKNPGYNVKNFRSAEDCLASGNEIADAYIVDYRLPGKSGIEFYEDNSVYSGNFKNNLKKVLIS